MVEHHQLYYDRNGRFISSSVTIADETSDTAYSRGLGLSDSEIDSLVSSAISSQKLPYDPNGVYFVLSDETVGQSSQGSAFCTHYCGWHTYTDVPGKGRVVSGWVGNAKTQCPRSCVLRHISSSSSSPNRDKGMSVCAHTHLDSLCQIPPLAPPHAQCLRSCITGLISSSFSSPNRDKGMSVYGKTRTRFPPLTLPHTKCPRSCISGLISSSSSSPNRDKGMDGLLSVSCIAGLISSSSASPNRDKGMDGLLSVYAHEVAEATSSPYLQTWMDDKGDENADKCGWK
ncbi:unnamed protein product [Closterium sp. Naga37s-1]|nr:unnamed protein product [Closterium sp. Naga37s-1]